jgi:hypothetical protein
MWTYLFFALVAVGVAIAAATLVVLAAASIKRRDPDLLGQRIPWDYMGVGLGFAFIAFCITRVVATDESLGLADPVGFALVFAVASAGFGVARDLLAKQSGRSITWSLPLALSTLMGVAGALSSVTF